MCHTAFYCLFFEVKLVSFLLLVLLITLANSPGAENYTEVVDNFLKVY